MLERYHAVARHVDRVRWLLHVLAAGACVAFVAGLFVTPGTTYFLGALVVLLWSLLMLALAQSFARPAPPVDPAAGLLRRLKVRFRRGYLRFLAVATTVLGLLVVYVTIRAVGLLARNVSG